MVEVIGRWSLKVGDRVKSDELTILFSEGLKQLEARWITLKFVSLSSRRRCLKGSSQTRVKSFDRVKSWIAMFQTKKTFHQQFSGSNGISSEQPLNQAYIALTLDLTRPNPILQELLG
jgi:hypothetical protein